MRVANAAEYNKTVADPNAEFESMLPLWRICRAVCSGERYVKAFDSIVDTYAFTNLLLPFSASMSQKQYNFYRAEAELPGIVSQFAKMLVGGLLRKQPTLSLPEDAPKGAADWIVQEFGQDGSPLAAFMDAALWEEVQTSRAWVHVDYPRVENAYKLASEDTKELRPYPVLWDAESVINWKVGTSVFGKQLLTQVVKRGFLQDYSENEFHPKYKEAVWVHELDEKGYYQIRVFQKQDAAASIPVVSGHIIKEPLATREHYRLSETITDILVNGERLKYLPIWPLNGSVHLQEPLLMSVVNKEISLYNKLSRRNHLLYGASTYTPIIMSDMSDERFDEIVGSGLGTWLRLQQGDEAKVLETPTAALQDMDRAIAGTIEEMSKMGIRMLSPEVAQSGLALEIRNAAQTAQLASLNNKISNTMAQIITFMLNWKYGTEYLVSDINFSLSEDFSPVPLGADWLRLATEWYQGGLIPRSVWLLVLKQNDIIPPDYDDERGMDEINSSEMVPSTFNYSEGK
jgi:hypothetical protein